MLSNFEGWLFSVISISCVWIYLYIRKGPVAALGAAMVLSFAVPVWLKLDVAGVDITVRTAVASITMIGYLCHRDGKIISPLTLLDCGIAMIWVCHVVSDSLVSGATAVLPFRAYGEWVLPYVAGRFAISNRNDLKWIAPWVIGVVVFLSLMSCIESLSKINLFETVFGNRPVEMANRDAMRLGFKRAFGPAMHSIFFGVMIAVLVPWLTCGWEQISLRNARWMAALAGLIALAGAFFTMSRTPVVSLLLWGMLTSALRFKVLRWPIGLFLLITIVVFAVFPYELTDMVSRLTGGNERVRVIEIDGEAVISSSSRSRLHYFGIYAESLVKAGLFGFGTEATSGFPLQIPGMQGEYKSANLFRPVDNGYILTTLRLGWVGGGSLLILFLTAIWTGFSLYFERPDQLLPGAIACLLLVFAGFSLLLVFMNYDFGLLVLWNIGILSGLSSARNKPRPLNRSYSF